MKKHILYSFLCIAVCILVSCTKTTGSGSGSTGNASLLIGKWILTETFQGTTDPETGEVTGEWEKETFNGEISFTFFNETFGADGEKDYSNGEDFTSLFTYVYDASRKTLTITYEDGGQGAWNVESLSSKEFILSYPYIEGNVLYVYKSKYTKYNSNTEK